jgi:hypothetical protein
VRSAHAKRQATPTLFVSNPITTHLFSPNRQIAPPYDTHSNARAIHCTAHRNPMERLLLVAPPRTSSSTDPDHEPGPVLLAGASRPSPCSSDGRRRASQQPTIFHCRAFQHPRLAPPHLPNSHGESRVCLVSTGGTPPRVAPRASECSQLDSSRAGTNPGHECTAAASPRYTRTSVVRALL